MVENEKSTVATDRLKELADHDAKQLELECEIKRLRNKLEVLASYVRTNIKNMETQMDWVINYTKADAKEE